MKTLFLIYVIGFILVPVITIWLNKIFPESMYKNPTTPKLRSDKEERIAKFCFASFLWVAQIFVTFYCLLDYWYLHSIKNNSHTNLS